MNCYNRADAQVLESTIMLVEYARTTGDEDQVQSATSLWTYMKEGGLSFCSGSLILWLAHQDPPFVSLFLSNCICRNRHVMTTDEWMDVIRAEWSQFKSQLPDTPGDNSNTAV